MIRRRDLPSSRLFYFYLLLTISLAGKIYKYCINNERERFVFSYLQGIVLGSNMNQSGEDNYEN